MDARLIECPICMRRYSGKIYLCETGHSLCEQCRRLIKTCPKCFKPMTQNRSYDLEAVIEGIQEKVKVACENTGCSYTLNIKQLKEHQFDCKFRKHTCHGAQFSGWSCNWNGLYGDLLEHYKVKHPNQSRLTTCTKPFFANQKFENFHDVHILPFLDAKQLFYYKHKVDKRKQMAYWVFQFVGPTREAHSYTYEFEINKGARKFKVTGICSGDTEDVDELFETEDCVCMTFKQMKLYLTDKGDLEIRFRIMNLPAGEIKKGACDEKIVRLGAQKGDAKAFVLRGERKPAVQKGDYEDAFAKWKVCMQKGEGKTQNSGGKSNEKLEKIEKPATAQKGHAKAFVLRGEKKPPVQKGDVKVPGEKLKFWMQKGEGKAQNSGGKPNEKQYKKKNYPE